MTYKVRRTKGAKGKAPLSRSQVKAVAKIAKRVDVKNDETKMLQSGFAPIDTYATYVYVNNVTSGLAIGGGRQNRLGVKITNPTLYYKIAASPIILQNGTTRIAQRVFLRVLVFKANQELTTPQNGFSTLTSSTSLKPQDMFLDWGNDRLWNSYINTREITVLKDQRIPLDVDWDVSGTYGKTKEASGKVKLGKVLQFNDNATGAFMKHKNVYLAYTIGGCMPLGAGDLMGRVQANSMLTFKDA